MDLWQLNIFRKVVELEGFSKAGKAVHLSQPTISSHIKALENHFGCQLIDRLGWEGEMYMSDDPETGVTVAYLGRVGSSLPRASRDR